MVDSGLVRQLRHRNLVLVAAAIAIVLGHVCAAPVHAHTATGIPDDHEHGWPGGAALHEASCEAAPAGPVAGPPPVAVVATVGEPAVVLDRRPAGPPPAPPGSPPLPRRHAVLLI